MEYNFEWVETNKYSRYGKYTFVSIRPDTARFYININAMTALREKYDKIKGVKVGVDAGNKKMAIVPVLDYEGKSINLHDGGGGYKKTKIFHNRDIIDKIRTIINTSDDGNNRYKAEYSEAIEGLIVNLDETIDKRGN